MYVYIAHPKLERGREREREREGEREREREREVERERERERGVEVERETNLRSPKRGNSLALRHNVSLISSSFWDARHARGIRIPVGRRKSTFIWSLGGSWELSGWKYDMARRLEKLLISLLLFAGTRARVK